jgi:sterol desaturase/sphingolipid hydroxylase (fatty acid hydroxylase superfamily)
MNDLIIHNEPLVRLVCFAGIFVAVAIGELIFPRRVLTTSKTNRWIANVGIIVLGAASLRVIAWVLAGLGAASAVGMAVVAEKHHWGILNYVDMPLWSKVIISVVVLDFIIYLQHVMFHAIPTLWRLHMMHHADLDFDLTTGNRFHPIEIILSMGIKIASVMVLGAPAVGVVLFEVILNGVAMFNHSNMKIPLGLDRVLRLFMVTPDMHRVHHSVIRFETNSNFGFNLPWWDRLMGTYRAQPQKGHDDMTIGLNQFRDAKRLTLPWLVVLPFIGRVGAYPINWRGMPNSD